MMIDALFDNGNIINQVEHTLPIFSCKSTNFSPKSRCRRSAWIEDELLESRNTEMRGLREGLTSLYKTNLTITLLFSFVEYYQIPLGSDIDIRAIPLWHSSFHKEEAELCDTQAPNCDGRWVNDQSQYAQNYFT